MVRQVSTLKSEDKKETFFLHPENLNFEDRVFVGKSILLSHHTEISSVLSKELEDMFGKSSGSELYHILNYHTFIKSYSIANGW